jgi:uncharacterized membrane protein YciS (DUF1049 family)
MVDYEGLQLKKLDPSSFLKGVAELQDLEDMIERYLIMSAGYSPSWADKLAHEYKDDVAEMLDNLSKLMALLAKAGMNPNWLIAAVSLAIQDIYVQRVAARLKIDVKKLDDTYKTTRSLLDEIRLKLKKSGIKTTELKVAKAYSEDYRNEVIHGGLDVDEDKALDIMRATSNLIDALSSV